MFKNNYILKILKLLFVFQINMIYSMESILDEDQRIDVEQVRGEWGKRKSFEIELRNMAYVREIDKLIKKGHLAANKKETSEELNLRKKKREEELKKLLDFKEKLKVNRERKKLQEQEKEFGEFLDITDEDLDARSKKLKNKIKKQAKKFKTKIEKIDSLEKQADDKAKNKSKNLQKFMEKNKERLRLARETKAKKERERLQIKLVEEEIKQIDIELRKLEQQLGTDLKKVDNELIEQEKKKNAKKEYRENLTRLKLQQKAVKELQKQREIERYFAEEKERLKQEAWVRQKEQERIERDYNINLKLKHEAEDREILKKAQENIDLYNHRLSEKLKKEEQERLAKIKEAEQKAEKESKDKERLSKILEKAKLELEIKEKVENYLYNTPNNALKLDIIKFINETQRIIALGSDNKLAIALGSYISGLIDLVSTGQDADIIYKELNNYYKEIDSKLNYNYFVRLARFTKILQNIFGIKLFFHDFKIAKNASKLAKYNKDTQRNILLKSKLKQFAWLAANKILPYLGFGLSRKIHDKANISEIFSKNLKKSDGQSVRLLEILKTIADISEITRKFFRNKIELGDFEAYQASR